MTWDMEKNMENGKTAEQIFKENYDKDMQNPVGFSILYLGIIPHKKQQEVLLHPAKNKVIVSGRRSGKTELIAVEWTRGAVLDVYHSQILIAPTYKQAMIVFDKILEIITKAGVYDDIEKITKQPYPKIEWKNGAWIDFASADNPNSIRGFAYDRVGKDESAFIKKGADNAIKPLTYDKGAPVWEFTSPWGKGDVWEKWQRCKGDDPDWACFHYYYKDNCNPETGETYLSEEGIKEIEKDILEYGEDSIYVQCEIYGKFVEDRDVYFSRELVESCIEDYNIPVEINKRFSYWLGVDFARMGQDKSVFIPLMGYGGDYKVNDIIETQHKLLTDAIGRVSNMESEYNFVRCLLDETGLGSGPTDILNEKFGYKVKGIYFTIRSKMDMYSHLKKLMSQGKLKIPNHKKLIFELMDLRYEIMSNGDLKLHHSEKGHDDYPDALALACWASRDEDIEWVPTIA